MLNLYCLTCCLMENSQKMLLITIVIVNYHHHVLEDDYNKSWLSSPHLGVPRIPDTHTHTHFNVSVYERSLMVSMKVTAICCSSNTLSIVDTNYFEPSGLCDFLAHIPVLWIRPFIWAKLLLCRNTNRNSILQTDR